MYIDLLRTYYVLGVRDTVVITVDTVPAFLTFTVLVGP